MGVAAGPAGVVRHRGQRAVHGYYELPITTFASSGNTIANIYSDVTKAIKLHWAARFLAPDTILVHPSTAAEWLNKLDTTNRPLFVPHAQGPFNAAGIIDNVNAQGPIGSLLA